MIIISSIIVMYIYIYIYMYLSIIIIIIIVTISIIMITYIITYYALLLPSLLLSLLRPMDAGVCLRNRRPLQKCTALIVSTSQHFSQGSRIPGPKT